MYTSILCISQVDIEQLKRMVGTLREDSVVQPFSSMDFYAFGKTLGQVRPTPGPCETGHVRPVRLTRPLASVHQAGPQDRASKTGPQTGPTRPWASPSPLSAHPT